MARFDEHNPLNLIQFESVYININVVPVVSIYTYIYIYTYYIILYYIILYPCVVGLVFHVSLIRNKSRGTVSTAGPAPLPHPLLLHLGPGEGVLLSPQENTVVLFNTLQTITAFHGFLPIFNSTWILHLRNNTLF